MSHDSRVGKEWHVWCLCSQSTGADALEAVLRWNNANLIKRVTPSAKLAALRELNRKIKEKGLA